MTDFIRSIRKIVLDAVNAQKLTTVVYGIVESVNPLKVRIDQRLILEAEHLVLTRAVKDYTTEIQISSGARQPCTIYNALKVNDKVTMIRQHGGQQYLIIDKEVA
ncbi:MAG: DUF2577 domain-containing protein [Solibacillus sp.]